MNPISRERLFGFQHAFDQPIVLVLVATVAGVLVVAAAAIGLLVALRLVNDRLRRELIQRYVSWLIIIPCVVGPILLGAAWTMLLVAVLSLLCYREFARATGFFREKLMSLMVVVGILAVNFAIIDHWYGFFVALAPLTIIIMAAVAIQIGRAHV